MACQEPKLEIYILIFRAPRAGLAPDSWLAQQTEIATDQKCFFYIFGKCPQGPGGPPGLPGGPVGHLSHENEALGPRKRSIGVPTPNFDKKMPNNQKNEKKKNEKNVKT